MAAKKGNELVVKALVACNADIEARDKSGLTAVDVAEDPAIIKILKTDPEQLKQEIVEMLEKQHHDKEVAALDEKSDEESGSDEKEEMTTTPKKKKKKEKGDKSDKKKKKRAKSKESKKSTKSGKSGSSKKKSEKSEKKKKSKKGKKKEEEEEEDDIATPLAAASPEPSNVNGGNMAVPPSPLATAHNQPQIHEDEQVKKKSNLPCKYFMSGHCRWGTNCIFSHGTPNELDHSMNPADTLRSSASRSSQEPDYQLFAGIDESAASQSSGQKGDISKSGAAGLSRTANFGSVRLGKNNEANNVAITDAQANIARIALGAKLYEAAMQGDLKAADAVLNKGAEVDFQDESDWTPLHTAVVNGHGDMVQLLVDHSPDPNMFNNVGKTPLHYAASAGFTAIVRTLIWGGADVNMPDAVNGQTALHMCAAKGHMLTVRTLLDAGADVFTQDNQYKTPMSYATEENTKITLLRAERIAAKTEEMQRVLRNAAGKGGDTKKGKCIVQ